MTDLILADDKRLSNFSTLRGGVLTMDELFRFSGTTTRRHAAQCLIELGFSIFPCAEGTKAPILDSWLDFWAGQVDFDILRFWGTSWLEESDLPQGVTFWNKNQEKIPQTQFRSSQTHNIGIRTGSISGIMVVDEDYAISDTKNVDGRLEFERKYDKEMQDKILPPTFTQRTPRGGHHRIYRIPEGITIKCNTDGRWVRGIDIKGDRGMTIGPGSVNKNGTCTRLKTVAPLSRCLRSSWKSS